MEYIIGLILGLMLGLSGAGGVIAVPLIMVFLNLPVHQAMGTALGAVMLSALLGVISQRQHVLVVPSIVLGLSGMLLAPLGRYLGGLVDDRLLLLLFFLVSASIAVGMWLKSNQLGKTSDTANKASAYSVLDVPRLRDFFSLNDTDGSDQSHVARLLTSMRTTLHANGLILLMLSLWGVAVGFVSGLLGIGGGVFIIPILRYFLNMSMRAALASSLMVVVMVSSSGFFTSLFIYHQIELLILIKLSIAGMLGIHLGHKIGVALSEKTLQKGFSVSLILVSGLALSMGM